MHFSGNMNGLADNTSEYYQRRILKQGHHTATQLSTRTIAWHILVCPQKADENSVIQIILKLTYETACRLLTAHFANVHVWLFGKFAFNPLLFFVSGRWETMVGHQTFEVAAFVTVFTGRERPTCSTTSTCILQVMNVLFLRVSERLFISGCLKWKKYIYTYSLFKSVNLDPSPPSLSTYYMWVRIYIVAVRHCNMHA